MSNQKGEKVISQRQAASIISSSLIGVGVLTLPRVTASAAHEAAWLSVLVGAVVTMIPLIIITKLGWRFPTKHFVNYSAEIVGSQKMKKLGRLLTFPLILFMVLFYLVVTASTARTFGEVVVTAVLRETPLEVVIATMLLTSLFLIHHGVEVVGRVNEILLPIIVIPVLSISLFAFQSFELEFILPVWPDISIRDFLLGVLLTSSSFQGYEIILFFSSHTQMSKKSMRLNMIGLIIPSFIYLLIVIAGISVFGNEELALLMWPTLEIIKVTQVPGLILERMESAFLGVWVAAVFTTTANFYYVASMLFAHFVQKENRRFLFGILFFPIIFWLSLQPQNVIELFEWQEFVGYAGLFITFILPAFFLTLAILRKKGQKGIPDEKKDENVPTSTSIGESK